MKSAETLGSINSFNLMSSYVELDSKSPLNVFDDHIHNECEIYVNLSGDVSFAVENSVYPVMAGSVIITRPLEYHHCIYHTNQLHKHFWILFSAAGNERLFDIFYKRERGKKNLLMFSSNKAEEIFSVCRKLTEGCNSETERYFLFFKLINILNSENAVNAPEISDGDCIKNAINYINNNLQNALTVNKIAAECNVSLSTLERRFWQELNISPSVYIKKKRLASALALLSDGKSVTEAAEMSGFSDCSSFISVFKKNYRVTPLQYKKRLGKR